MQLAIICIVVLHDLLCLVGDGGRDGAGVGGQVVLDLCLPLTVLTAAVCQLGLEGVGVLHVGDRVGVDCLLDAEVALHHGSVHAIKALKHRGVGVVEAVQQAGVHGVETVAQTVLQAIQLVDDTLIIESTLDIRLSSGTCQSAAGCRTIPAVTKTVAVPVAKSAPQSEQDHNDPPCTAAVAVPVAGHSSDVSQTRDHAHHTIVKHIISSFGNFSEWKIRICSLSLLSGRAYPEQKLNSHHLGYV